MLHGVVQTVGGSPEVVLGSPVPSDPEGKWYVAHTRSRNEKILSQELTRLGIFNYLPLARRVTRSAVTRRISKSMVPVFPGYLFFHGNEDQRYRALRTNRIANVLDEPNQDRLYAELLNIHAVLSSEADFVVAHRLKVGDWVRITTGPLRGLEGMITGCPNKWRLYMNVTTLGQSVNVEVDKENVEPIDPPGYLISVSKSQVCRI